MDAVLWASCLQRRRDAADRLHADRGTGFAAVQPVIRRPREYFLSVPLQDQIKRILSHLRFDEAEVIVATDGERARAR